MKLVQKLLAEIRFHYSFNETNHFKKNRGFTLVELSIYMGLLAIVLVVLTEIFATVIENQLVSENVSNVSTDGRFIYTRFIYDVNRASAILTPSTLGSSSASLILTINGENLHYILDDGNLTASDSSSLYRLNGYGTTVSNLLFTRIGNSSGKHTVRINYTITGNIEKNGRIETKDFQTTAGLR